MVSKNENEQKACQMEASNHCNHMGKARKQEAFKRQVTSGYRKDSVKQGRE